MQNSLSNINSAGWSESCMVLIAFLGNVGVFRKPYPTQTLRLRFNILFHTQLQICDISLMISIDKF